MAHFDGSTWSILGASPILLIISNISNKIVIENIYSNHLYLQEMAKSHEKAQQFMCFEFQFVPLHLLQPKFPGSQILHLSQLVDFVKTNPVGILRSMQSSNYDLARYCQSFLRQRSPFCWRPPKKSFGDNGSSLFGDKYIFIKTMYMIYV